MFVAILFTLWLNNWSSNLSLGGVIKHTSSKLHDKFLARNVPPISWTLKESVPNTERFGQLSTVPIVDLINNVVLRLQNTNSWSFRLWNVQEFQIGNHHDLCVQQDLKISNLISISVWNKMSSQTDVTQSFVIMFIQMSYTFLLKTHHFPQT